MTRIRVGAGLYALIDKDSLPIVAERRWSAHINSSRNTYYAISHKPTSIRMHRLIAGAKPGQIVDHINGNGLDNRRANLRIATQAQNQMNRRPQRGQEFKGVCYRAGSKKWRAQIQPRGRFIHLGEFDSAGEAALAYDAAARNLYGPYARTNFAGGRQ